jgi:fatty acid desaturase
MKPYANAACTTHDHTRYTRGYKVPEHAREFIKECHETWALWTCGCALADHSAILALGALGVWAYLNLPLGLALVLYVLLSAGIARFQRGLECLVHEASHYNWLRSQHCLNDRLGNWLVARPVFSEVNLYRKGHKPHHRLFGSEHDTDLARYRELAIEDLSRSTVPYFIRGMAQRIGRYVAGWWRANRSHPRSFVLGIAWHLTFLVLPLALITNLREALLLWLLFWLVPFTCFLPWQRFIAEAAKHQYRGHDNEFDSTVSNIGVVHRWLLHPHNDGFHLVHHLFPGIPHHQLKRTHYGLSRLDPEGFGHGARSRLHLLEDPDHK